MPRIPLIDTARGVALLAMASYHFTWDLEFFRYLDPGTATQGFFRFYARAIASSFLFLAGVSVVLAHYPVIRWHSFGKRFAMVAGAAALISVATLIAIPGEWIHFGILHNIALSSFVGLAFLRLPPVFTTIAAIVIIVAILADHWFAPGLFSSSLFNARELSWIGFAEIPPRSNDYVPLFPWIAALLAGIALTRTALTRGWLEKLGQFQKMPGVLAKAGKHSLLIYLIHQPILIGFVFLFSQIWPAPEPNPRITYARACEIGCTQQGNEARLCQRFCDCTAARLGVQNLLTPLHSGQIGIGDDRVQAIAQECSAAFRP